MHRRRIEDAIENDIRDFIERETQENIERGMTPQEARFAALRKFGNVARAKEHVRAVWGWVWLEQFAQDIRYGLRTIRKSPVFAAVAILSLALGIGANTAIFGLMDNILWRMLPIRDPENLLLAGRVQKNSPKPQTAFSYAGYATMRSKNRSFEGMAASGSISWEDDSAGAAGAPRDGEMVSGNYFSVLGVRAAMGRAITPEDDDGGGSPVAVLSDRYWTSAFHRDPAIPGRKINVNGRELTVIGVAPAGFFGIRQGRSPDIYMPLLLRPLLTPGEDLIHEPPRVSTTWLTVVGRLKPGIGPRRAEGDLSALMTAAAARKDTAARITLESAARGISSLRRSFSEPLKMLMAIVALVLLNACLNLANLLLARGSARRREIAMRLAIGASRGRIVRQLLTESLTLSLAGGALGVLFAIWSSRALVEILISGPNAALVAISPDPRVLAFAVGLSVITALLFGIAPALRACTAYHDALNAALKTPGPAERRAGSHVGRALVVAQVALSAPLLMGACLFIGTLSHLRSVDKGFASDHVLQVQLDLHAARSKAAQEALFPLIEERVRNVPGIRAASLTSHGLMDGGMTSSGPFHTPGYAPQPDEDLNINETYVHPDYFTAAGIPLRNGRAFTAHDDAGAPKVAVINQTAAKRFWPGRNAVGQYFGMGSDPANVQVVGLVPDAKYVDLRQPELAMIYYPYVQLLPVNLNTLVVRTDGDPGDVDGSIRHALRDLQPGAWRSSKTLTAQIDATMVYDLMMADLSGFFGALAVLLASIGIYGVMAYSVQRRTNEIGVRMALGASAGGVTWLVLREALLLAAVGVAIGVPVALELGGLVRERLFGVRPQDPGMLILTAGVMLLVGCAAAYLPARKAARLDPMITLRTE